MSLTSVKVTWTSSKVSILQGIARPLGSDQISVPPANSSAHLFPSTLWCQEDFRSIQTLNIDPQIHLQRSALQK